MRRGHRAELVTIAPFSVDTWNAKSEKVVPGMHVSQHNNNDNSNTRALQVHTFNRNCKYEGIRVSARVPGR